MMRTFERDLPKGYQLKRVVDEKSVESQVWLNIFGLLVMLSIIVPVFLLMLPSLKASEGVSIWVFLAFILGIIVYIFLHELTHGVTGYILIKQKPKFGINSSVAYCYFEGLYLYRAVSIITLLSPFVVFSVAFLLPAILCKNAVVKFLFWLFFSVHFGGCMGDLFDAYLLIFKFRANDTLMLDDGPKQSFFVKGEKTKIGGKREKPEQIGIRQSEQIKIEDIEH